MLDDKPDLWVSLMYLQYVECACGYWCVDGEPETKEIDGRTHYHYTYTGKNRDGDPIEPVPAGMAEEYP